MLVVSIQRLNIVFSHRLSLITFAGWFVRGLPFGSPPTPPQIQGQAPKNPRKNTPLCHFGHMTGGCFFRPSGGRNASATAEQTRWSFLLVGMPFNRLIYISGCQLGFLANNQVLLERMAFIQEALECWANNQV